MDLQHSFSTLQNKKSFQYLLHTHDILVVYNPFMNAPLFLPKRKKQLLSPSTVTNYSICLPFKNNRFLQYEKCLLHVPAFLYYWYVRRVQQVQKCWRIFEMGRTNRLEQNHDGLSTFGLHALKAKHHSSACCKHMTFLPYLVWTIWSGLSVNGLDIILL